MTLAEELKLYGSDTGAEDFNDIIGELHAVMHPMWNTEQLLYRPRDEVRYCEAVRARCGQGLPDEMILRRLNNIRKRANGRKPKAKPKKKAKAS